MKQKTLIDKIVASYNRAKTASGFVRSIKRMGFKHLGGGATREAFGNDKIVIKIGKEFSNDKEFSVHNKLKKHPIWKYATVPIYKFCTNYKIVVDYKTPIIKALACRFESILISAQAKTVPIKNKDSFTHPKQRGSPTGFVVQNKKYHKQAIILNDVFNDCHDENIKEFGKSLVMVDLNSECDGIICPCNNSAKKYEKCINFKAHKKLWEKQRKAIARLKW